jgi:hypothetical protein
MGTPKEPPPAKLFVGVITGEENLLVEIRDTLTEIFGPVDAESPLIPFAHGQRYYAKEMGADLKRKFFSFSRLINQHEIADAKCRTNNIEDSRRREDGTRRVNLDPGFVSPAKVVLATTKNFSHRIYLDAGIFAEVTLAMRHGVWESFPYTYPDYKLPEYIEFFTELRKKLMSVLRGS